MSSFNPPLKTHLFLRYPGKNIVILVSLTSENFLFYVCLCHFVSLLIQ